MTNLLSRIYDYANGVITADVDNATTKADTLEADNATIDGVYHYAGDDSELDDALQNAVDGDTIIIGNNSFATNRTIDKRVRLISSGGFVSSGSRITGDWTFSVAVYCDGLRFAADTITTITGDGGVYMCCSNENETTTEFIVEGFGNSFIGFRRTNFTFKSVSDRNIVDSSTIIAVTDNGTNTVGDIA
jgi:hypothetical protein